MKIENLPNEIVEDFNYMFDTYLKEDILNKWKKKHIKDKKINALEEKVKEDIYKEIVKINKQHIYENILELYNLALIFKNSTAPIKAKDYERFYKDIIHKKEELQKYSNSTIKLDNVPLHPNILYYLLDFRLYLLNINHRDFTNFIFSKIKSKLELNENENDKKPKFTKINEQFFLAIFGELIKKTEKKEHILKCLLYIETLPFKS